MKGREEGRDFRGGSGEPEAGTEEVGLEDPNEFPEEIFRLGQNRKGTDGVRHRGVTRVLFLVSGTHEGSGEDYYVSAPGIPDSRRVKSVFGP